MHKDSENKIDMKEREGKDGKDEAAKLGHSAVKPPGHQEAPLRCSGLVP